MPKKIDESIILKAKDMYVNEHISSEQIAKKLNIGASTVVKRLRKLGVEVASHPHAGIFNVEDIIRLYVQDNDILYEVNWAYNKAYTFLNFIYNNCNIALDRKFNIYSSLFLKENSEKLGNIGENPTLDNTEINSEIKKSESLYSVDLEPLN